MYSSRMRTVCNSSRLPGRCAWFGGGGGLVWGWVSALGGAWLEGSLIPGEGVVSQHVLTDVTTGVKT